MEDFMQDNEPEIQTNKGARRSPKSPAVISSLIIAGALLAIGVIATIGVIVKNLQASQSSFSAINEPKHDGNTQGTAEENSIANVAEKVSPSVVSILTTSQTHSFYGTASQEGAGTGIIVSKDGYVMTNNHVIANSQTVSVVDYKGVTHDKVSVIGRDPLNDIAFLKISDETAFTPAEIGNSSTLRIGQQVVAIGNALGQYSNTVTSGIISGTGRPITASSENGEAESLTDLLQTDASINPGNSGGPLVNLSGQIIGINTAIAEDANGIGFAIPINAAKGILKGVLAKGTVDRAFLGVRYLSVTPDVAKQYNLPVSNGAYIYAGAGTDPVSQDGPAARAGLKSGDIITKVNDDALGQNGGLSSMSGLYQPGDTVTITYLRGGKEQRTQLTFGTYQQP